MKITIELPDIEPLAELEGTYLKQLLICNLYNLGKLSAKEAREVLQVNPREFEALLPEFGFSIISDTDKNIAFELNG